MRASLSIRPGDRLPSAWTRTPRRRRLTLLAAALPCALTFFGGVAAHSPLAGLIGLTGAGALAWAVRRTGKRTVVFQPAQEQPR